MMRLDPVVLVGILGSLLCCYLSRRASARIWYRDEEGDGVSARSVLRFLAFMGAVVAIGRFVALAED